MSLPGSVFPGCVLPGSGSSSLCLSGLWPSSVDQIPGNFTHKGPKYLTIYFIKITGMRRVKRDVNFIVLVHVTIGRRLLSLILTTILPTLLLNLIRHTAN